MPFQKERAMTQTLLFSRFAKWMSQMLGHPLAFGLAVLIVIGWAVVGPLFQFSNTWQLVINTGTTIITFLMVFLIQNSQNRDSEAMQVKLDELIRAIKGADNSLLNIENMTEQDLQDLQKHYIHLAQLTNKRLQQGERRQQTTAGIERKNAQKKQAQEHLS
jgi:low affinity Fe/Cu permease